MHFPDVVTERDCGTDGRDVEGGIPVHGGHLPSYEVLHRCQDACMRFLHAVGGFDQLLTPHLEADLHGVVIAGELDLDVGVHRIGRTSFTLTCDVRQRGRHVASSRFVMVSFDYEREATLPLSATQRAALETHLVV